MAHRAVALASLGWLVGAACTLDTSGGLDVPEPGVGGASTSTGEGGGLLDCEVDADCPGFTDNCLLVECRDASCTSEIRAGEPCAEKAFCDATGNCLGSLGAECTDGATCNSGVCADGVCCQRACDGLCEGCDAQGACEPVASTEDPADECMPGVCDGARGCASGEVSYAYGFGAGTKQRIYALAASPTGDWFIGGENDGDLDVDGTPIARLNGVDAWVAKRNADGTHAWVQPLGGQNDEVVTAVASDATGNVYACGFFTGGGGIILDGIPFDAAGGVDAFLVKLDGTTGDFLWARTFGAGGDDRCLDLAVDPATGDVLATGVFRDTVDFGGPVLDATDNDEEGFVVRFAAANGAGVWGAALGGAAGVQVGRALAVDANGAVVVTGVFDAAFTLGPNTFNPMGGRDAFVAKLAGSTGGVQWSQAFGADGPNVEALGIAVGPEGEIVFGGSLDGVVDFGGGGAPHVGGLDGYVVELNAMGQHVATHGFGTGNDDRVESVAVDGTGAVVFGGWFEGALTFGPSTLMPGGAEDGFVAKLSVDGLPLWAQRFGADQDQRIQAVDVTSNRTIGVGGWFDGDYEADETTFSADDIDALFLQLLP